MLFNMLRKLWSVCDELTPLPEVHGSDSSPAVHQPQGKFQIPLRRVWAETEGYLMAYSQEEFEQDKAALDAARDVLSALVVGEKTEVCSQFGNEYSRISQYFDGISQRRVLRTFLTITSAPRITGMECREFNQTLEQVDKMLKSKRQFFRRQPKKCFKPLVHRQPCFCARLAKSKARMDEPQELAPEKGLNTTSALDREEQRLRRELLNL